MTHGQGGASAHPGEWLISKRTCSSHRLLTPVPLLVLSQHHSTAQPSPKRCDNRYEQGDFWKRSWQNPKNLASRISDLLDRETAPNARDMQNLKFMVNVRRLTVLSIRPYSTAQNTSIFSSFVSRYLDCGSRSVGGKRADPGCLHKLEIEVQDCGT